MRGAAVNSPTSNGNDQDIYLFMYARAMFIIITIMKARFHIEEIGNFRCTTFATIGLMHIVYIVENIYVSR